jgi:hypothetical protein
MKALVGRVNVSDRRAQELLPMIVVLDARVGKKAGGRLRGLALKNFTATRPFAAWRRRRWVAKLSKTVATCEGCAFPEQCLFEAFASEPALTVRFCCRPAIRGP